MPAQSGKHQIRRVVETVYSTPWIITEAKLQQILDVLDRRQLGHQLAREYEAQELDAMVLAGQSDEEARPYTLTAGGVAVLPLYGVISQRMNLLSRFSGGTSTEQFSADFRAALADPNVKAIVLDVDSPGGSIAGTPEAADVIFSARGQKPVVAVANTQMCSGAYWIASAAGEVVASPSSSVGSIGVIYVHAERSKADAAAGVTRRIIKAGKWKGLGNQVEPLSESSQAKLQSWIDSGYDLFVASVARYRGVSDNRVRSGFGEGDSLMARDAKAEGLVDRVATLEEVVAELEAKISAAGARTAAAQKPSTKPSTRQGVIMDPKVKAALFARGLLPSLDTSDESAQIAVNAFYAARGGKPPDDPAAIVADLFGQQAPARAGDARASDATAADAAKKAEDELVEKVAKRVGDAEAYRVKQVRAACDLVGLDEEKTKAIVAKNLSLEDSRGEIKKALAAIELPLDRIEPAAAEIEKFAASAEEALTHRCMASATNEKGESLQIQSDKLSAGAKELLGFRLVDLAAESLKRQGVRTRGLAPGRIATLALQADQPHMLAAATGTGGAYYTSGSFPQLALNSARKVLMRAYQEAPVTWRLWARQGQSVADFKLHSIVKFGESSDLDMVPENQPFPSDTGLSDDREYFVVEVFGAIKSLSFRMIVNDDLNALSKIPARDGTAAARTFNKLVYGILTGNPNMADSIALFHASSHGANLLGTGSTTAAPPSVSTLQAMQTVMRTQHGLNADSTLNTPLRYVIAPVALEATAMQLITSITDPASSNASVKNYFNQKVLPVIEPILDATSAAQWYGAADSALVDTIEVVFLQGEETPVMESWWDPETDTRKHKVRQTGAAVLVDYRGLVKHIGYSA
jgi:signal peptide peptidase SppA